MKVTVALCALLLFVCAAHAQPVYEVRGIPGGRHLVEDDTLPILDNGLLRARRSPGGWQTGGGGGGGGAPQQPQPQASRGSVSGSVHRERGVGTVVQAQGQGAVWSSRDGNARVDAHGQWSRVVRGPARGSPNYNVGVTYTHRF